MTFRLTAYPASDGDCLMLSYGDKPTRHVLIDGGRKATYSYLECDLKKISEAGEAIELLVLTHIDADHIEGLLPLIEDVPATVEIKEIWFNGHDQLAELERLGFAQADALSAALAKKGLQPNTRFSGGPVLVPDTGPLPSFELAGGLSLTLLSPDGCRLRKLSKEWAMWRESVSTEGDAAVTPTPGLERLGRQPLPDVLNIEALAGKPEKTDTETPNGSSIAFVATWNGRSALLTADAHPDLLEQNLLRLFDGDQFTGHFQVFKVSHHGSNGNTSRKLTGMFTCDRVVVSTDGSRHSHPDPEAVAKIVKFSRPQEIVFNYDTDRTQPWADEKLTATWQYCCRFGSKGYVEIDI